jgi:alpha-1,3-mannosyltransferase
VEIHVGADDSELRALIGRASYIASASRYEGFGLSVVEGMSAGLVPILRPIPPFKQIVERTGCGYLVDMDDPIAAALQVRKLHQEGNPARRVAAITAAARFSWTGVAARFAAEYRNLLSGGE